MAIAEPRPIPSDDIVPALTQDPPFIKFPPFPTPPSGVTIMPFKDFRPRGIQLFSEPTKNFKGSVDDVVATAAGAAPAVADDDDAELDALGIPTVELRVKHSTDECKSSSHKKRKKKKAAAANAEAVPVKKLPWYEEWEEGEDLRVTKVRCDSSIPPVDRLFQCAFDFRTGRPWPPVGSGLNNLWDQFRLFTGLLVNPSVFRKVGSKKYARADSPDFESDDEDDHSMANVGDRGPPSGAVSSRPAKRQRSGEGLAVDDEDGAFDDPHKMDEEVREEKITIFLSDPEKAVRIFLSSYMREHGLIWSERNLIHMPRLISFFLAFVLRNRVFPEPAYQRGLKKALEAIEWAKKELPLTHKVGLSIPDAFNEACRECFGRKGGINWSVVNATNIAAEKKDVTSATITVTNVSNGTETKVALPTEAQTQLEEAIEDNVDMEDCTVRFPAVASPTKEATANGKNTSGWGGDGWGNGDSNGWGNEGTQENEWAQSGGGSWGDGPLDSQGASGTNTIDTGINVGSDSLKWTDSNPSWSRDPASLLSLLGPSAFPLTHTTGIVECSTRRVAAIHFPAGHPKSSALAAPASHAAAEVDERDWSPSACGVEAELDARFAKVVLEPWGREEGDIPRPEIWSASRGPVVDPNVRGASSKAFASAGRKPHDPFKDSITLLVEPSFAETLTLVPGLGLGAMWIEIVRQRKGGDRDMENGTAEVDGDTPGRFWYHEDVTGIFPSFYTT